MKRTELTLSEFKDFFAEVPRHVAVLGLCHEDKIYGVTISSLQTVSIEQNQQILSFTLRSGSFFASKLKQGLPFTFNILSRDQIDLSEYYSNPKRLDNEEIKSEVWSTPSENFVFLHNSYLSASVSLISSIDVGNSSVFFFSIRRILNSTSNQVLLYGKRTYGTFLRNSEQ
jgi:flavin reductase (DIM6/NTAB) family NADH-FMN oxidoreductase RutF